MAISRSQNQPGVFSTSKHSILNDIDTILERVGKVFKGNVKFLDLKTKQGTLAIKALREARANLEIGLIPTNQE